MISTLSFPDRDRDIPYLKITYTVPIRQDRVSRKNLAKFSWIWMKKSIIICFNYIDDSGFFKETLDFILYKYYSILL